MLRLLKNIMLTKLGIPSPLSATIDVTDKCNLSCAFCTIWRKEKKCELDPVLFSKRIQESRVLRNTNLYNLGGGEPFLVDLNKYIEPIVKYAKPLQIRIVSNGSLPQQIQIQMEYLLQKYDVNFVIKISIDGYDHSHDLIRGRNGLFAEIKKTLGLLRYLKGEYKNKLDYGLGFTTTSVNIGEIAKVYTLAVKENISFFYKPVMSIDKFNDCKLDKRLPIKSKHKKYIIDFNKNVVKYLKRRPLLERIICIRFYQIMNDYFLKEQTYIKCYAMDASFYITPDGNVTPCLNKSCIIGNINKQEFDDIWFSDNAWAFRSASKQGCRCLTPCDTIPSLIVGEFPFYF